MTSLRSFQRNGELLRDDYFDLDGKSVSVAMPLGTMNRLCWGVGFQPREHAPPDSAAIRGERDRVAARLIGNIDSLTADDMIGAGRCGDRDVSEALEARFSELMAQRDAVGGQKDSILAAAARAVLLLNSSHVAAARTLADLLFDERISTFTRTSVAGHLAEAYEDKRRTEAMLILRDALVRLLRHDEPVRWAPFAYGCVEHLLVLKRRETLALCETDLSSRDEASRGALINRLSRAVGADVLAVLRDRLSPETSPRLRLRLMAILGEFASDRARLTVISEALANESPWCRWQAIQELWRLRPKVASDLARRHAADEPDELLRELLERAAEVATSLGKRRLRSPGS